jgi:hypothetical protein
LIDCYSHCLVERRAVDSAWDHQLADDDAWRTLQAIRAREGVGIAQRCRDRAAARVEITMQAVRISPARFAACDMSFALISIGVVISAS